MRARDASLVSDGLLFVVLAALLAALVLPLSKLGGGFDDDGIYLLGAQSIAQGTSYRALHLPGEPYQTKYPPLLPLILAGVMRIFPEFPGNLPWLLLPGILAAAGTACLWRRILRDRLGFSDLAAIALCSGALLGRQNARLASMTMSEMPFALLATASALALASPRRAGAALAGLLAGLATLTRLIGLSLPLGFAAFLLARRRFRDLALFAAVYCAVLAPWWGWRHAAARANGALVSDPVYAYDLAYASWLLAPAEALHVAWVNAVQSLLGFGATVLGGAFDELVRWLQQGGVGIAGTWGLSLFVAACMARGAWCRRAQLASPLGAFLAAYLAIVLVWPFETQRFFAPFLVVIPALFVAGLASLVAPSRRESVQRGAAIVFAAATGVCLLVWIAPLYRPSPESPHGREVRLLEAIRASTREDEVLATSRSPSVALYTGRKSARLWSYEDPLVHYPRGRSLAYFYLRPRAGELRRVASGARARAVFAALRRAGVERIVVSPALDLRSRDRVMHAWIRRLQLPTRQIDGPPFETYLAELRGPALEALLSDGGRGASGS